MKKLVLAILAGSMIACNNETTKTEEPKNESSTVTSVKATLTEEEVKDGWQLLFDGATTKGWHTYGGGPVHAAWKVVDGNLQFDVEAKKDTSLGDIITDEE